MTTNDEAGLRLGTAKKDITPDLPIYLAGFAHRTEPADAITSNIHLKVWCFADSADTLLFFIQADLIWWGPEYVARIRDELGERYGIGPDAVILHASHTHSAPQGAGGFVPMLGPLDPEYMSFVVQQALEGAEEALGDLDPVSIVRGTGEFKLGVYRRKPMNGQIAMAPNPDVSIDEQVTVISFKHVQSDTLKGVWFHLACHPTITADNAVSSEFLGTAAESVASHYENSKTLVSPLQGTGADIRPNLSMDGAFFRGTQDDVQRYADHLSDTVIRILSKPAEPLASGFLRKTLTTVDMPFMAVPAEQDLIAAGAEDQPPHIREWSALLQSRPDLLRSEETMQTVGWALSPELLLLTFNGEMVSEYGRYTKEISGGRALPLGYSNGMIGYVPTADQLDEGGYESLTSFHYFGLPSPYQKVIEHNIKEAIHRTVTVLTEEKEQ